MSPPDSRRGRPHSQGSPSTVPTEASVTQTTDTGALYRTSAVKRSRRTNAELRALHLAILTVCTEDHPLTVRGVFYRVMSAGAVEKTEKAYAAVQREVLKLRRAGFLPYEWIADGTRWQVKQPSWDTAKEALDDTAASYRRALWHNQDTYVEVWSEKDAIASIVSPTTDKWDVPLMIARGFASESFLWSTANTIRRQGEDGKDVVIYQLGDHDPFGIAAWEHVQTRLAEFAPDAEIHFERLAVTESQIWEYNLPTRPKLTDRRAKNFAGESVEVDALATSDLREIVENAILSWIDPKQLRITQMVEAEELKAFRAMAAGWKS
jgi:hypothetical protein